MKNECMWIDVRDSVKELINEGWIYVEKSVEELLESCVDVELTS